MSKLTDSQLVVLSAAAQRDGGATLPLPASLTINKGAAAAVLKSLVKRGLIAEQPAGRDDETWRDVDGQRTMLVITEAGLEAIGVVPDPAPPLSRNLLARAVTHRIQEKAFGRLRPAAARRLRRLTGGIDDRGANAPSAGPALKPGSRRREWRAERIRTLGIVNRNLVIFGYFSGLHLPRDRRFRRSFEWTSARNRAVLSQLEG